MKKKLYILLTLFYVMGIRGQMTAADKVDNVVKNMTVDGVARKYMLYVPKDIEENRPLMISLHGMYGDGNGQREAAQWEKIADTERFIAVYPYGLVESSVGTYGWDVDGSEEQDFHFFEKIIDKMAKDYKIDRKRVYLSGFSMGGMMTYHAINERANLFAAFAPVGGYPLNQFHRYYTSSRPVPIIHQHGKNDDFVKVDSVPIVVANWVMRNGCKPEPVVEEKSGKYTKQHYKADKGGFEYIYYAVNNRWHEWKIDNAYNPSKIAWDFVSQYSLDDECDATLVWYPNLEAYTKTTLLKGWKYDNGKAYVKRLTDETTYKYGVTLQGKKALTFGEDVQYPIQLLDKGNYKLVLRAKAINEASKGKTVKVDIYSRKLHTPVMSKEVTLTTDGSMQSFELLLTNDKAGEFVLKLQGKDMTDDAEMAVTAIGLYTSNKTVAHLETSWEITEQAELKDAASDLDGQILMATSADMKRIWRIEAGYMPFVGSSTTLSQMFDKDNYCLLRFTQVSKPTGCTVDGNLYTLQMVDTEGNNYAWAGDGSMRGFLTTYKSSSEKALLALGDATVVDGRPCVYGHEMDFGSLWQVSYIEGKGYILSNVAKMMAKTDSYASPASEKLQSKIVYTRLFEKTIREVGGEEDKSDDETAINAVPTTNTVLSNTINADNKIYDLNGHQITSLKKGGIYIQNGIKVLVK